MYLHWHAVKDLDKIYMREQLRVAGDPKPRIIGIDEISIKKGGLRGFWWVGFG